MKVVIIDYGAGNIFSVQQAFKRLGVATLLSNDKVEIASATHVVFPGVGHAKTAMEQLKKQELETFIPTLKQPVLGICLGMQLLCTSTEEGNTKGLSVFRSHVSEFVTTVQVPHMGWNDVVFTSTSVTEPVEVVEVTEETYYFVHSFKAGISEDTWGVCDYDSPFSAALKRDNFWGVQFHPEKSGEAGERLLKQFLQEV